MRLIPYGRQDIDASDLAAVARVLQADFITQGPEVERFERAAARYCGVPHAVAVNSGTSALHIACLAAGLAPGDLAWTVPVSFAASANCARYCGADVDFVDIDPKTLTMSPHALERKLARASRAGRLPKVLIPVHFGGSPCDLEAIAALARPHGIRIIEDACQAFGANYRGSPIGACAYSDMAVFSFHPVKSITTAEGGMVTTRDAGLQARLARLRSHGIERDARRFEGAEDGPWYHEMAELGFNYRLTDIQAALGTSQLARIDAFLSRRNEIAERYRQAFRALPLEVQHAAAGGRSANHLFVVQVGAAAGISRRQLFDGLWAAGIRPQVHYIPVHLHPYYRKLGFKRGDFPAAEAYYERALSLPIFVRLAAEEQEYVISTLSALVSARDNRERSHVG